LRRIDGSSGIDLVRQRKSVTQLGQELQLELAQHRRLFGAVRKPRERGFILVEQARVRILAREKLQQQLVQIETAQQRRSADQRQATAPFCPDERLELARTGPGERQRLERLQYAALLGARAARPARDHRYATVGDRERLDDSARLPIRIGVQDERGLIVAPLAGLFHVFIPVQRP